MAFIEEGERFGFLWSEQFFGLSYTYKYEY